MSRYVNAWCYVLDGIWALARVFKYNRPENSGMIKQNFSFGGVREVLAKRFESFKRKLNTWDLTFYLQTIRKKTTKTAAYSPHICARCTTCADVYLFTVFLLELTEKCKHIRNRTCPMKPVTAVQSERFIQQSTDRQPHRTFSASILMTISNR